MKFNPDYVPGVESFAADAIRDRAARAKAAKVKREEMAPAPEETHRLEMQRRRSRRESAARVRPGSGFPNDLGNYDPAAASAKRRERVRRTFWNFAPRQRFFRLVADFAAFSRYSGFRFVNPKFATA